MKKSNKIIFISALTLLAVGSALIVKNYNFSSKQITKKELHYRLKKLEYTESFILPQIKNNSDFNNLLKSNPTAAGSIDVINLVSAIRKEALKSTKSSSEYPLPLLAHWNTGDTNQGMTPGYIISLIEDGYHILPSWRLKPYWQQQLPDEYYKSSILKAKELNLPLTFIVNPIENTLTNESYYFGLPANDNPNALDMNSNILNKLSPFGPDKLWSEIGQNFSHTQLLKNIQNWYPNPPLVMFVDNTTPNRLSWREIGNSSRFTSRYGNKTDDNFKRIVGSAHWIEKYRLLHEAIKNSLTSNAWKTNIRFVSYNPISLDIGNTKNWIDKATITNQEFSLYPLIADAMSVRYFADDSPESISDSIFKLNNLPFVFQQAHKQNSSFSCQLSINDSSYFDTLDKYKGFAQLALWLARPNMIRELNTNASDKSTIISRYKALLDSVELIYNDDTLQYFWKYGKLVANKNKKIQEASNVPYYFATSDRWFLLNVDINPQGAWNKDENIPVFAIALQVGTKPNRKWLVLAQSFDGNHQDISVTIPRYKSVIVDSSSKGNFYLIGENTSNQVTPLEQMPPAPVEKVVLPSTPVEKILQVTSSNQINNTGIIKQNTTTSSETNSIKQIKMPIYYISNSGTDTNVGSISSPLKTIEYALGKVKAGGTIILREGKYVPSTTLAISTSGTPAYPVTIKSYPGETAIISSMFSDSNWSNVSGNIYEFATTNHVMNVSQDGVPMRLMIGATDYSGSADDLTGAGQWSRNTANNKLWVWTADGTSPADNNIEMSYLVKTIDVPKTTSYIDFKDITIEGGYYPIQIEGDNINLTGVTVRNSFADAIKISGWSSGEQFNSENGVIDNCEVYNFGESGVDITGGDYWTVKNTTIRNGVANRTFSAENGIKVNGVMIKNNAIGTTVDNCIIKDMSCMYGAIILGGNGYYGAGVPLAKDTVIKNNTISNISSSYIISFNGATNTHFINNILKNNHIISLTPDTGEPYTLIQFHDGISHTGDHINNYDTFIERNKFYNNDSTGVPHFYNYYDYVTGTTFGTVIDNDIVEERSSKFDGQEYTFTELQTEKGYNTGHFE